MTVGVDTYIGNMILHGRMALPRAGMTRYPSLNMDEMMANAGVDAILLSSEPYPFKEKDAQELRERYGVPVLHVDGQLFSWYGTLTPTGIAYAQRVGEKVLAALSDEPFL